MQSSILSAHPFRDLAQLRIGQRSILLSFLLFFAVMVLSPIIQEFTGWMESLGSLVLLTAILTMPALFIAGTLRLTAGFGVWRWQAYSGPPIAIPSADQFAHSLFGESEGDESAACSRL